MLGFCASHMLIDPDNTALKPNKLGEGGVTFDFRVTGETSSFLFHHRPQVYLVRAPARARLQVRLKQRMSAWWFELLIQTKARYNLNLHFLPLHHLVDDWRTRDP